MLSPVCPSVRRVYHRKTVEVRIMKFSALVFAQEVSSINSKVLPRAGASNKEGWEHKPFFKHQYLENGSRYGKSYY